MHAQYIYKYTRLYSLLDRNLRYKVIWGFTGKSDGYGLDADFIYNLPEYQKVADAYTDDQNNVDRKRGGPYDTNAYQDHVINTYMSLVQITATQFDAGNGTLFLFDLQGNSSG